MTFPKPMPITRRITLVMSLLGLLILITSFAGVAPVFRRWFGEWVASAG